VRGGGLIALLDVLMQRRQEHRQRPICHVLRSTGA
jgi:hypothetical protein